MLKANILLSKNTLLRHLEKHTFLSCRHRQALLLPLDGVHHLVDKVAQRSEDDPAV